MAISNERLIEQLSSISLLPTAELSTLRDKLSPEQLAADAEQLAKELVKSGKLTKFQAVALYSGKGKGLVFGEYVVLDKLGAGGMGQVFKARHRRMKRMAAIKVLPPHVTKDPQTVRRFYQEVEMAAKLNHPNIVQSYDAAEANGLHYLVMEYVDGRDLSSILAKQGPLNIEQVMNCIRQAAEGLAYAHNQAIVHRDIKPGNLLVDKSGTVKILDMGLARTVDALESQDKQSNEELTQAGQVMGTVDYMAPEQARDARQADHRADIYSLGCTLYRLLTGYTPFPADTMVKKLMAHATQPIPSLTQHCPEVPPRLEELYQRMMQKNPQDRIGSAKEVADALQKLLGGASEERSSVSVLDDPQQADEWQSFLKTGGSSVSSSISTIGKAAGSSIGQASGSMIGKRAAAISGESPVATTKRPQTALYGGIAAAAVVLLAVGGWLALRGGGDESNPEVIAAVPPTPAKPVSPSAAPSATASVATATAIVVPKPSPTAAPTPTVAPIPTPSPTAVALNLPTVIPTATPTATGSMFGIATTAPPIPAALPTATASGTAAVSTTKTAPPPESGENYALYFDGTSIPVTLPDTLIMPASHVMTWEVTVWPRDSSSNVQGVVGNLNTGGGTSLELTKDGVQVVMGELVGGKGDTRHTAALAYKRGYRVRLAAVFDEREWRLFADGKLIGRWTDSGDPAPEPYRQLNFGASFHHRSFKTTDFPFHGTIDEVRISSIARYSEDYSPVAHFDPDEHTLALYHFDEGTGTILGDHSGNGHHGTITGAKWVPTPTAYDDPRLPVPSESETAKARASIAEKFPSIGSKKPAEYETALSALFGLSITESLDATQKYALFQTALSWAAEAGRGDFIVRAADEIAKTHRVEAGEIVADPLAAAAKVVRTPAEAQVLADTTSRLIDRLLSEKRFAAAQNLSEVWLTAARKLQDAVALKAVTDRQRAMQTMAPTWSVVEPAFVLLRENPDDVQARTVAGRFLCLTAGEWRDGLPLLAGGNDVALASAAMKAQKALSDPNSRVAAADEWFALVAKAKPAERSELQTAAYYWCLRAVSFAEGADRTRLEQRLKTLAGAARTISFYQALRERRAAEWTIEMGGKVSFVLSGTTQERNTGAVAGLPTVPFIITQIIIDELPKDSAGVPKLVAKTGLSALSGLLGIQKLVLRYTDFPDSEIKYVGDLPTLTYLDINDARVTDSACDEIAKLTHLEFLNTRQTDIDSPGIIKLSASLKALQEGSFENCLDDRAAPFLKNFTQLKRLSIPYCKMTDASLPYLAELKTLEVLTGCQSQFSDPGLATLQRALPRCKISK